MGRLRALLSRLTGQSQPAHGSFPDPTAIPPSIDDVDPRVTDRLLAGIDTIDWGSLDHAYGPATTTPTYLRALLSSDPKVRDEAVEHLWSAVTHQGTVYSATVAATPFLLRILGDEAGRAIRPTLLAVIEVIAGGTSYHDVHGHLISAEERATPEWDVQLARELTDVAGCRRVAAKALDLVIKFLEDPVEDVRLQATSTATAIGSLREVPAEGRARTIAALDRVATDDPADVVRGSAVLSLSLLGGDTRRWLDDPTAPVRVSAALSPGLRDEPHAHEILLDALSRPEALDALFPDGLPHLRGFPRFTVIAAICDRVPDRERALGALLGGLRLASNWTVDLDRAPMLRYFFPPESAGADLTEPQRVFLEALLERPDLWDPKNGNAIGAFRRVGLPYSADGIREVVRTGRVPPGSSDQ